MADERKKGNEAEAAAPKKKSMKWIVIGAALIVLVGGGAFAALKMKDKKGAGDADAKTGKVSEEVVADAKSEGGEGEAKSEEKSEGKSEGEKGEKGAKAAASAEPPSLIYKFTAGKDGPESRFIVNLMDPTGHLFLQTSLELKATSTKIAKQLAENDAPLRDAIIMLISSKRREEIDTPAGKERFKRELLARVEGIIEPKAVSDVYFTDWVVIYQ